MKGHHPLSVEWRSRAEKLRSWGALDAARFFTVAADELDAWHTGHQLEALSLTAAADESGYSTSWLGRLVADDVIENVGRPNAPMIRRCDLPRKLKPAARRPHGAPSLAAAVLAKQGIIIDPEV